MTTQSKFVVIAAVCAIAGVVYAQQFPMLDMVANKVIQKYQSSSCQQLWQNRGKAPSEQEQRVLGLLKSDPQMRQEFFNRIAGPVMNKMFDCGMIP